MVLAESLDYSTTLARVAELAVPVLADFCIVDVIDETIQTPPEANAAFDARHAHHLALRVGGVVEPHAELALVIA